MTIGRTHCVVIWALLLCACSPKTSAPERPSTPRIISLAPALTSILFGLGLGPQVVGVTRFCDDPPEAQTRAIVGGFSNPDLEAILSLRPTLVIGGRNPVTAALVNRLDERGVASLLLPQDTLESTYAAITAIGKATSVSEAALALSETTRSRVRVAAEAATPGLKGRRVLLVYGRRPLVVAGRGSYGDELLNLVGAVNVAAGLTVAYPEITAEEVLRLSPELVIDADMAGDDALGLWKTMPGSERRRVVRVNHPGLLQPGIRAPEGLSALAAALAQPDPFSP